MRSGCGQSKSGPGAAMVSGGTDRNTPDNQAWQTANWCSRCCCCCCCRAGTSCCHQGSATQGRCFSWGSRPCHAQEVVVLPNSHHTGPSRLPPQGGVKASYSGASL